MKRAHDQILMVAAASEVALVDGAPATRIKLLPIGEIALRDGRGPYMIRDRAHAERVVAATRLWLGGADMMIDYDHQAIYAPKPGVGGVAVAAGWVKPDALTVEDDGIYGLVEWTQAAAAKLAAREYRYTSPLFTVAQSGDVLQLKNAALVNIGAIDLPAIAAGLSEEDDDMDKAAMLAALGLAADADSQTIAAAIDTLKKPSTSAIAIAAGLSAGASVMDIAAAVTTLKAAGTPDLSNYVPKDVVEPIRAQLKKLTDARLETKVDELIAAGVVLPAKREGTLDWFRKDEVAASAFFDDMPALIAPGQSTTRKGEDGKFTALTPDEIAACAAIGQTHEDFLRAKNEEIA